MSYELWNAHTYRRRIRKRRRKY